MVMNSHLAVPGREVGIMAKSLWAILALAVLCPSLRSAETAAPPALRYRFAPGTTNVFKLELEMKTEDGKMVQEGSLMVVTSAAEAHNATLVLDAKLRPPSSPMRSPMYGQAWNPFEFRGVMYGPPSACQVEMEDHGRVLRTLGELRLPPPFDELYRLLYPLLPETPLNQWTNRYEQSLPADTWGGNRRFPSYYGGMGPGNRAAKMTASRQETYQVVGVKDNVARLREELTVESWARLDNTPRWSITGTAELDYDLSAGAVVSIMMPCTAVWTSETTTRRAPMVLRCTRVSASDQAAVLATIEPPGPITLSDAELRRLLEDLKEPGAEKTWNAANRLMAATVPAVGPETLALLETHLQSGNPQVRLAVGRILAQHATPSQVPWLLSAIKGNDASPRMDAAQALGRLKEKRAIDPLVEWVARGTGDAAPVEALKLIGPAAEPAVLGLLRERNLETRRRACEILQAIGTSRSLEPLRTLRSTSDDTVSSAARQAIQEIEARQETRERQR